jgi:hypothetical protein
MRAPEEDARRIGVIDYTRKPGVTALGSLGAQLILSARE